MKELQIFFIAVVSAMFAYGIVCLVRRGLEWLDQRDFKRRHGIH